MKLYTESQVRAELRRIDEYSAYDETRNRLLQKYTALPDTPIEVPEEVINGVVEEIGTVPWWLEHNKAFAKAFSRTLIHLLTQPEAEPSKEKPTDKEIARAWDSALNSSNYWFDVTVNEHATFESLPLVLQQTLRRMVDFLSQDQKEKVR